MSRTVIISGTVVLLFVISAITTLSILGAETNQLTNFLVTGVPLMITSIWTLLKLDKNTQITQQVEKQTNGPLKATAVMVEEIHAAVQEAREAQESDGANS